MEEKSWNKIAFEYYQRSLMMVSILDFNYPIAMADEKLKKYIEDLQKEIELHSDETDAEKFIADDGKWKQLLVRICEYAKEAQGEKEDYKRFGLYYRIVNRFTDFADLNR